MKQQRQKPKKILLKTEKSADGILLIKCDNGLTYNLSELAKEIGMSHMGLNYRFKTYGWQHPNMLIAKNSMEYTIWGGNKTKTKPKAKSMRKDSDWEQLSNRSRAKKLLQMPEPTKFDRLYY